MSLLAALPDAVAILGDVAPLAESLRLSTQLRMAGLSASPRIEGLVGERRRQRYEQIARENGISMAQITVLAYEQAVEATRPGHYIQLPNGAWTQK